MEKSLEYLALNQKGSLKTLNSKISSENIKKIQEAGYLIIEENHYSFNEKGIDFYSQNIGQYERTNFLGL